ncbi:hypothetical protein CANARDRAFT_27436 [[Candida] arabinofermentans NRRL YB-2248]|uniref:UV radiation resistance-associated gene protein n=1 Tax=[Candida] arabinofermentans NRRL YB-2248 TaxID=983967 RepID=A0A1E4T357_9ASCO|nr:hypothetical protein CANARDRAFT_27436 [[Candida] arabinofermentans NRRL YB-2248]
MTSVPHLDRRRFSVMDQEAHDTLLINPIQRKIRHIKSIYIKNIQIDSQKLKKEEDKVSQLDRTNTGPDSNANGNNRLGKLKTKSTFSFGSNLNSKKHNENMDILVSDSTNSSPTRISLLSGDLIQNQKIPNRGLVQTVGLNAQLDRQLKLQEVNESSFFDCFYTLNEFMNIDKPFFVSRVFTNSVNLSDELSFPTMNKKSLTLNLYIKLNDTFMLFNQYHLKLSFLLNVGSRLDLINLNFKNQKNLVIVQLFDDNYYITSDNNLSLDVINFLRVQHGPQRRSSNQYSTEQYTCSFDQIMKLNNLTVCIVDLLSIKKDLSYKIENQLSTESELTMTRKKNGLVNQISHLKDLKDRLESSNSAIRQKLTRLKSLKASKEENLKANSPPLNEVTDEQRNQLAEYLIQLDNTTREISKEKSSVAHILSQIFPIEPPVPTTPQNKYDFQLLGYRLPPKLSVLKMTRADIESTNSLLGYLVLLLVKLSTYLQVPLRYPLKFLGSNSYIVDPISKIQTKTRIYPLFVTQNTSLAVRFEFGLSLLIKDLKQLFEVEGLVKVDDFNLLGNFKILLTCIEGGNDVADREVVNEFLLGRERINVIKKYLMKK